MTFSFQKKIPGHILLVSLLNNTIFLLTDQDTFVWQQELCEVAGITTLESKFIGHCVNVFLCVHMQNWLSAKLWCRWNVSCHCPLPLTFSTFRVFWCYFSLPPQRPQSFRYSLLSMLSILVLWKDWKASFTLSNKWIWGLSYYFS